MQEIYARLGHQLAVCGAGLDMVVKTTEFVTPEGLGDYRKTAEVRREVFAPPFPAATGVLRRAAGSRCPDRSRGGCGESAAMSTYITDELRSWIGREATYTAPEELGQASIRYFAMALGDDNPVFSDAAFARVRAMAG